MRENRLELRRRSAEELAVDGAWINKTGLVAEGLAAQPYIHLDIRTPFGESVGERQVEQALADSLGQARDRYAIGGWHIQFVEDTNLGSNHRIFVDLVDVKAPAKTREGMDACLSLELAVEALGELVAVEKGEANFQLLYGSDRVCYSLLFLNGSPFHVLRVAEGAGAKAAARLRRHREYAGGAGRNGGGLKTFLAPGDPLWEGAAVKELRAETLELAGARMVADAESSRPESGAAPAASSSLPAATVAAQDGTLLHLGLAHAARQRDLAVHNRVEPDQRRRNDTIRTRFRLILALSATAAVCLLIAGGFWAATRTSQSELRDLSVKASAYQAQVDSIHALRLEKNRLENSLAELRPVWHAPIDWERILGAIAAALPREAGIDGLAVNRQADGGLELSFRAWVRDWNQVQAIQRKLSGGKPFKNVSLSEQRKDLATGVVIFHVTAGLERP